MVGGLTVLVVVLVAASVAGFALRGRQGRFRTAAAASRSVLTTADLGAPLGEQATLVQFSTEVCAYCGPTRKLLAEVAGERNGVAFVEVDAAARMDLTKRLGVLSTPTVLVLDSSGGITSRASGPQRKADVVMAVGKALDAGGGVS